MLVRRLQTGDPGGHARRAVAQFPIPGIAERVLDRYFVPGGVGNGERLRSHPMGRLNPSRSLEDLMVLGNFVEIYLAKEGHEGRVGVNLLTKIQAPTIPSLYGAMLAGVDAVLMGAGIPREIPRVLDDLAAGRPAELRLDVKEAARDEVFKLAFDPGAYCGGDPVPVRRPDFYPIISSAVLATMLAKKATGSVEGFIVEGPTAGGHNAPPRGKLRLSDSGEPIYGDKDVADLEQVAAVGLPFWLAGS